MATAQPLEHCHVGIESLKTSRSADELVAEARLGADLARALIKHITRMQAAGYDNEILVDSKTWTIRAMPSS